MTPKYTTPLLPIDVKKLYADAKLPMKATDGAGAYDLYAYGNGAVAPGEMLSFGIGLAMSIPRGYVGFILPRSGFAFKNQVTVVNAPGTIDSDYRGEIKVGLINHGKDILSVGHGDRIAQMAFVKTEEALFLDVDELNETERGTGGLGSTGTK